MAFLRELPNLLGRWSQVYLAQLSFKILICSIEMLRRFNFFQTYSYLISAIIPLNRRSNNNFDSPYYWNVFRARQKNVEVFELETGLQQA